VGRPRRCSLLVFVIASVTTAVLSQDDTVMWLTPVVIGAPPALAPARNRTPTPAPTWRIPPRCCCRSPTSLTCGRLRPVGHPVLRLSALPWLAGLAAEYAIFCRFFAADLDAEADLDTAADAAAGRVDVPVFVLAIVGLTPGGFVVTSLAGLMILKLIHNFV
jgi:arsenical pump membrane protein